MRIPNAGKLTFDVIKVPLFHADGSRKGLVIVGRDVSDLKRAEEALRHSLNEYSELVQRIPVGITNTGRVPTAVRYSIMSVRAGANCSM